MKYQKTRLFKTNCYHSQHIYLFTDFIYFLIFLHIKERLDLLYSLPGAEYQHVINLLFVN